MAMFKHGKFLTNTFLICALLLNILNSSCSTDEKQNPLPVDNSTEPTPKDTATTEPPVTATPAEHTIITKIIDGKAKFWNTEKEEEYVPRGVNYFWIVSHNGGFQDRFFSPGDFDPSRVRDDFKLLVSKGFNTVRIFLDTCNAGPDCIGNTSGPGLNPSYLENIALTIQIANDEGIFLLLTSNDIPDTGGYSDLSNEGANSQFAGYRNAHYLTEKGVASAQLYWGDLLKALYDRGAPLQNVLAWSLLNEQWYFRDQPPFSLGSEAVTTANGNSYDMSNETEKKAMAVESMVYYIKKVRETIDQYDPNALVTMGFFVPDYPNPMRLGDFRYVETADLLLQADLDFFDFHGYPGEDRLAILAENYGMQNNEQKPIVMGEFGAFLDRYSSLEDGVLAIQDWQAESCAQGFDGWLYWGLYRAPVGIGDASWAFKDQDKEMLNGLAPQNYPDACDEDLRLPINLALNKPVTASNYLEGEIPEMAVDGNINSQWGSGHDAEQWISIDLEVEVEIDKIMLHVAQFPAGNTNHLVEGSTNGTTWTELRTFSGDTDEGDILTYEPSTSVTARYIRVTTTASPSWVSWKEITVFGK